VLRRYAKAPAKDLISQLSVGAKTYMGDILTKVTAGMLNSLGAVTIPIRVRRAATSLTAD
jgi:hypothetical protein